MKLLRNFGFGILWALLTPFLLVAIALVAVYGVGAFFVEFLLMIIHFFQGKKLFPLFEEDEKALAILQREIDAQASQGQPSGASPTIMIQQNYYGNGAPQAGYPQMPYPGAQAYPGQLPPNMAAPGQVPTMPYPGQQPALPNPPVPELQRLPQATPSDHKEDK